MKEKLKKKFKCLKFHKIIHLLPNLALAKTSSAKAKITTFTTKDYFLTLSNLNRHQKTDISLHAGREFKKIEIKKLRTKHLPSVGKIVIAAASQILNNLLF